MARIAPPDPAYIQKKIGLAPAQLGYAGDEDEAGQALRGDIGQVLEVEVMPDLNSKVDVASSPWEFPFTVEKLALFYPWKDDAELLETFTDQEAQPRNLAATVTALEIVGRAVPGRRTSAGQSDPVVKRYDELKAERDRLEAAMLAWLAAVAAATLQGQAQQAARQPRSQNSRVTVALY